LNPVPVVAAVGVRAVVRGEWTFSGIWQNLMGPEAAKKALVDYGWYFDCDCYAEE